MSLPANSFVSIKLWKQTKTAQNNNVRNGVLLGTNGNCKHGIFIDYRTSNLMLAAELYVNCAQDEVYENDSMQPQQQTTDTDGVAGTLSNVTDDNNEQQGVVEEKYENVRQIQQTPASAERQRPTSYDVEDDRRIYQNVSRKPIPAPKPKRPRF